MISLEKREIIPLYLALSALGADLDIRLMPILDRLERHLFSRLTVDEMERLAELYADNVDVLEKKL